MTKKKRWLRRTLQEYGQELNLVYALIDGLIDGLIAEREVMKNRLTLLEEAVANHDTAIADDRVLSATNTKTINIKFDDQDQVNKRFESRLIKLEHKKSFFRR